MPPRGRDITLNGKTAYWPPELLDLGTKLTAMAEAGEITPEQAKREVDVLHEFMVLGCTVVEGEEPGKVVEVEQTSEQFRIPGKAVRQMEIGKDMTDPQEV